MLAGTPFGAILSQLEVEMFRRFTIALASVLLVCACGGGSNNPAGPTNNSSCFAIVGNKGTITANISGLANFSGIIPTGSATTVAGGQVPLFTIGAINTQDGTGVIISGQGVVGTSSVGAGTINTTAAGNSISVLTRSCTASTGGWVANIAFGSGTITVTSYSPAGVSGTFSATMDPGMGSTGTKTISGTFNATF
jgi:hypothetical protein